MTVAVDNHRELTDEERQEALLPELSPDTFTIGSKTFQLRELPNFYERKILRVGGDLLGRLDQLSALDMLDEFVGRLPRVVAVMIYATGGFGVDPTGPWDQQKFEEISSWVEQQACSSKLVTIVGLQLQKNGLADRVGEPSAQGLLTTLATSLSTLLSPATSKPSQG